jgi:short-subunit dehydrogenase
VTQKDSVVLILGASSGLGLELGRQYVTKGCKVVLAARREKLLIEAVSELIKKTKNVEYFVCDATSEESVKKLVEFTISKFNKIDVAIYSVGLSMHVLFDNITNLKKVMDTMMDVNFNGLVYFAYHVKEHLKKSKGALCGVSSIVGEISPSYITIYTAAKHAMNGFLESLANEEPGYSVTIAVPGYLKTDFSDKKQIGDGSIKDLKLTVDEKNLQPIDKAAQLVITAIEKKKLKYHLTNQGDLGTKLYSFFPTLINNTVKNEMKKINETDTTSQTEESTSTSELSEEELKKLEEEKKKKRTRRKEKRRVK